ncbi:MAG TPA: hypothetical protein VGG15_04835 [Terriglobales bacterium]|jgi:hypothetical protein
MSEAGIKDLLTTMNRAQAAGVIDQYAVGGALGATFYIEPAAVAEAEIFVKLPAQTASFEPLLAPIYQYLAERGDTVDGDLVILGSWRTRFLPVMNDLEHEALNESVPKEVDGTKTWVLTPEHLVGIALQTGRPTDLALAAELLNSEAADRNKLHLMLHRFGLGPQWHRFSSNYLETGN